MTDLCLVKHLGEFESAEVGYAKKKRGGAQLLLTEKGVGVGRENQGRRSQRDGRHTGKPWRENCSDDNATGVKKYLMYFFI